MLAFYKSSLRAAFLIISYLALGFSANAQSAGNSTSVIGTVTDPSGAVVPNAIVEIRNPVSGFERTATTDSSGRFAIPNVPFNPYHLRATSQGFAAYSQDVDVRSVVAVNVTIALKLQSSETVTVESGASDLLENDSTFHTDVDKNLFDKLPLESQSSSVSSLITLASPGVAADSNGLFHGVGDHAENSFSVDGQPITDQQSKVFSNQIPLDSIQSMEVIAGAPPAEYGEKASLVINVTTRSGQGLTTPHGSVNASYGSFGTSNAGFNFGYGGQKWGNFISANGLNSGRFLDPPEFSVMHAKGNEENVFDRLDFQLSHADSVHVNLGFTRSWFQTPNSFDAENATAWNGLVVANAGLDPNGNVVTNTGIRSDVSYVKGINNVKAGVTYQQTFLNERNRFGIVDPTFLDGLTDANGNSCVDSSGNPIAAPCTTLAPYDLTRGGTLFPFNGHTDVKLVSLYVQDAITKGNWSTNLGLRGDIYNGLTSHKEAEPRVGVAYNIKKTNTVLRASYARILETPFNENLVLSSTGCADPVLNPLLVCSSNAVTPFSPGWRNEFHVGVQQAAGRYLVFSGEYIWKYTHNAYDFGVFGSTPLTFPIEWNNSKIPAIAGRVSVPNFHGFSALFVFSSVASRFFTPQIGGAGAAPDVIGAFRIDHDEKFNQTTHLQYQIGKRGPWVGFNWRYDSGLVAGAVPVSDGTAVNLVAAGLTPDQEFQAGLFCGSAHATLTTPLPSPCPANQFGSTLVSIPAPGTENDDKNPPRIASRHLFDLTLGHDNLFHGDKYKWSLQLTAINITNKVALYNFLSTFTGTHYVTPRALTAQVGFNF